MSATPCLIATAVLSCMRTRPLIPLDLVRECMFIRLVFLKVILATKFARGMAGPLGFEPRIFG